MKRALGTIIWWLPWALLIWGILVQNPWVAGPGAFIILLDRLER